MNIQGVLAKKCFLKGLLTYIISMGLVLYGLWMFFLPSVISKAKAISTYDLLNIAYVDAQLRLRSPRWNESDINNFIKMNFLTWLSVNRDDFRDKSINCFVFKGRSNPEIATRIADKILLNDPLGIAHHGDAVIQIENSNLFFTVPDEDEKLFRIAMVKNFDAEKIQNIQLYSELIKKYNLDIKSLLNSSLDR